MQIERKGQNSNAGTFKVSSGLKMNRGASNINFVNKSGICGSFLKREIM